MLNKVGGSITTEEYTEKKNIRRDALERAFTMFTSPDHPTDLRTSTVTRVTECDHLFFWKALLFRDLGITTCLDTREIKC
jgi:hypothetical protein